MNTITIYMEGGGAAKEGRAALRGGMDQFLESAKTAARKRRIRWKLIPCGSRVDAAKHFLDALGGNPESAANILLVDAESAVAAADPRVHLHSQDGWELSDAPANAIQLMAQIMETWIVADPDAVVEFYGRGILSRRLPTRRNLEDEPKNCILTALAAATKPTRKGAYDKIRHGPALLRRIDARAAQERCRHCKRLFDDLGRIIAEA